MPGSLILSLLSFFASHLVVLTLAAFVVVGAHLAGLWGDMPGSLQPPVAAAGSPTAAAPMPSSPGAATRPSDPLEPARRAQGTPSSAPADATTARQPVLIGGALPNYASAGVGAFRPPLAGSETLAPAPPDREAQVQRARRAFWNGDFEGAEAAYVSLISRYPEDADAFGELGNLYQSTGRPALALDAYFAAAVRLRAAGNRDKLIEVIDLLETHDYPDTRQLRP